MGVKGLIRSILGYRRYQSLRSLILLSRDTIKGTKHNTFNKKAKRYSVPNFQTFFGYYDLNQFNKSESRILAHIVPKDANPQYDDCKIGYFDISEPNVFHPVSSSKAWCWQQGSRLRWGIDGESAIWFNDYDKGEYCCKCVSVIDGTVRQVVPYPLYDIDKRFQFGLTLDYERLQRYRPGYGYNRKKQKPSLDDLTIGLVKIETGEKTEIVSINSFLSPKEREKYIPYFNHLSFSPSGRRFLFFVVLKDIHSDQWKVKLYVKELYDGKAWLLEQEERASHYAWKDDNEILITLMDNEHHERYCMFNITDGTKTEIGRSVLKSDGHPTFLNDCNSFISDTYPFCDDHQELFLFSKELGKQRIGYVYHDPRGCADLRCDLHPRLSKSNRFVAIDSLNKKNERMIIVLKLED